ncbi:gcv1p [Saccharomyces arboricola H-6]|uniref:Aminomethyltransferase n=1 Tax=Saccharomyces arboricola (strain H-6 / AS 2.3317 / CBS 10644) TaxID=1160507 RepID=J8Q9N7_SACAR|nr:gcv1p [Saccharomyces arboricola H-6]
MSMIKNLVFKRFNSNLKKTALHDLHVSLGGTMVPYAGYSMPVLYKGQTHIESHNWTRTNAGLFDVSHMLQSKLSGLHSVKFLHRVTPTDCDALSVGSGTLSVLLNPEGGVVDDTIITKENLNNDFYIVTNAGCAERDTQFLRGELQNDPTLDCRWEIIEGRSLLALQGPKAKDVLEALLEEKAHGKALKDLFFGQRHEFSLKDGTLVQIARGGYTGEDGFEISVPNEKAVEFAEQLLANPVMKPIGLAARDSLRLEAGMCLYGHELDENITPVEAGLNWVISKSRRDLTNEEDWFNGYTKIMDQLNNKTYNRIRVAFKYLKKGPAARNGIKIFLPDTQTEVGLVTSGSASPSLNNINIGQGYVEKGHHKRGTQLLVQVRNKFYPIELAKMPLVPTHYYKQ